MLASLIARVIEQDFEELAALPQLQEDLHKLRQTVKTLKCQLKAKEGSNK